jgi:hypothetical protein
MDKNLGERSHLNPAVQEVTHSLESNIIGK